MGPNKGWDNNGVCGAVRVQQLGGRLFAGHAAVFLNEGQDDASAATNDGPGLGQICWLDSRLYENSNSKAYWTAGTYELDKNRHFNADWVDCVKSDAQLQLQQ